MLLTLVVGWVVLALVYGLLAPLFTRGITFANAFTYVMAFPFRALMLLAPHRR